MRLGLAGVLFAGLGLTAWLGADSPKFVLAPELKEVGLVVFVYAVGLMSGPGFFSAFRSRGLKLNLAIFAALIVGALVALFGGRSLGLSSGQIAGAFCGALTNTPALGAASDRLANTPFALDPALGYSVTYPFGVLGALLLLKAFARKRRERLLTELAELEATRTEALFLKNYEVCNTDIVNRSIGEMRLRDEAGVIVSRLKRRGKVLVVTKYTAFELGDVVTAVGPKAALEQAVALFGRGSSEHLESTRDTIDFRRVLLSKKELVGKSLVDLELDRRFNAQVTRLRRADVDLLPTPDTRLEMGDRLRIVAPRDQFPRIGEFFGDSERALAEIDYLALALGLVIGLLLAEVPLSVFGSELKLGVAGGPLLVALVLGRLGRSGPFVWTIPYEANAVLRELGLLLFLAGVGVSAGGQLMRAVQEHGLALAGLGALVTLTTTAVALGLLRLWAKAGVVTSLGSTTGMQTQPATLAVAYETANRSDEVYVSYAVVYPVAMIGKILLAQLLVLLS
jgi:putative transport protein